MAENKQKYILWRKITNLQTAKSVTQQAEIAAYIVAAITVALGLLTGHYAALVDALLFTLVGFGLQNLSRFAAVGGLVLFLIEKCVQLFQDDPHFNVASWVVALAITFAFINGVRGTFAHKRLSSEPPNPENKPEQLAG